MNFNLIIKIAIFALLANSRVYALTWNEIGTSGMWHAAMPGGDNTLFIGYGGYGAKEAGVKNWALALGGAKGFAHIVAVTGPKNSLYKDREKKDANLRLVEKIKSLKPVKIIVAAHSSGSFVAHEFLRMLSAEKDFISKTVYYDLDGAACLDCPKMQNGNHGFKFECVAAKQGKFESPNSAAMKACAGHFTALPAKSKCVRAWCLHGWMINKNVSDPMSTETYYKDPQISPNTDYLP